MERNGEKRDEIAVEKEKKADFQGLSTSGGGVESHSEYSRSAVS